MRKNHKPITREEIIQAISNEKKFLLDKYSIREIGLFGSFVRNEQNSESDIDIIVEFNKIPDLFTFVEIINYLKSKLNRKVDLITRDVLRVEIKNQILNEVYYI